MLGDQGELAAGSDGGQAADAGLLFQVVQHFLDLGAGLAEAFLEAAVKFFFLALGKEEIVIRQVGILLLQFPLGLVPIALPPEGGGAGRFDHHGLFGGHFDFSFFVTGSEQDRQRGKEEDRFHRWNRIGSCYRETCRKPGGELPGIPFANLRPSHRTPFRLPHNQVIIIALRNPLPACKNPGDDFISGGMPEQAVAGMAFCAARP